MPPWINGSIPYRDEGCADEGFAEVVGRGLLEHRISPAFLSSRRDVSPVIAQTELLAELLIDFLIIFRHSPPPTLCHCQGRSQIELQLN